MTEQTRFTKLDAGCVLDTSTKLEWTPTLNKGDKQVNWKAAKKLAEACGLLDGGWRLPTPAELVSIVDYGRFNPAIDIDVFPDTKDDWYWTDKKRASSPADYAWSVYFYNGDVNYSDQYYTGFVRAVRRVSASQ